MSREMVLGDFFGSGRFGPFNCDVPCPTPGCTGFERHNGACVGPNAKPHVSRLYKGDIIGRGRHHQAPLDPAYIEAFYGSVDNRDEHAKPQEIKYQTFWRCDHYPSAIDNWGDGIGNCEQCGAGVQLFDSNQPRTFGSAKNPRSEYVCVCGAWYHDHKQLPGFNPEVAFPEDGTDPFMACP